MDNIIELLDSSRRASRELAQLSKDKINDILCQIADAADTRYEKILELNRVDLSKMDKANPLYDRLLLTDERIKSIANDIRKVSKLSSPIGEILSENIRPNGMRIQKIRVPFGVIGVIYEARPNVSFDVFSLCFKTANAAVLKGGSDAHNTNLAIIQIIHEVLERNNINKNAVILLPSSREATAQLLTAEGYVDLLIPRGSSSLINYVRKNATIPVIETGAGICHTYIDSSADAQMARDIVFNAKTRRVSVCNALDCLIIHKNQLPNICEICAPLAEKGVTIYADKPSFELLQNTYPLALLERAEQENYGTEFLDYKMSILSVNSIEEAIEHITKYSSKHSEAIITEDNTAKEIFLQMVDAACVYHNVSTAFTDGSEFGFGAEIGISTQKLHARGPMALPELTSYKYIISGDGQTR